MIKEYPLLDNEFIITPNGVYTFVYFYRHMRNGIEVVLCGMNHFGDRQYFQALRKVLSDCDIVIFEGVRPKYWKRYLKLWKEIGNIVDQKVGPLELSVKKYGRLWWQKFMKRMPRTKERNALREGRRNWMCGDERFWRGLMRHRNFIKYTECEVRWWRDRIPDAYKRRLVRFYKRKLALLKRSRWKKSDIGEWYVLSLTNPAVLRYITFTLGYERERITMSAFDRALLYKKPRKIAIKFGAAHTARLRKHLEQRGFRCYKALRLCNIKFPTRHRRFKSAV